MKRIVLAIAAALASIPRYVRTWCARARDFVLELLPAAPGNGGLTTSAGMEAEDAVNEVQEAREEARLFKMTRARIALAWAAAVVSNSTPPDVADQDIVFQEWLADLEPSACRKLLRCSSEQMIERHLKPRFDSDHLGGVPSYGGCRPHTAPPVGYGSKAENAVAIRFSKNFYDELLSDLVPEHA